jgi:hypothetical protein
VEEQTLAPYKSLEKSETKLTVAVGGVEDVPHVVSSLVKAGVRITGVTLERPDVERTFVRLYQERSS